MSVDPNTLAQFAGKNVTIKLSGQYADQSGEGRCEAAGPFGVAFKPKGKGAIIVEAANVEAIEASAVVKKITRKSLLPATADNVRQHLVDRHGYKVSDIEAYSPEQALEFHATLEHGELGHDHNKTPDNEPAAA
jgi:hypothetical protein